MSPSEPSVPILLCETQPVTVTGVRSILDACCGLDFAGAVSTMAELESRAVESRTIVLVDKNCGLHEVARWMESVRHNASAPAIAVWGTGMTELEALRLLKAGARGILPKTASAAVLVECLQTLAAGGKWIDETIVRPDDQRRKSRRDLSLREREVLEMVERGLKNREIAAELGLQTGTVKVHLKHIFEKLGVSGRLGLALAEFRRPGTPEQAETAASVVG